MVSPLTYVEARLEHKYNSLKKHVDIVNSLKREIKILETEKSFVYFQLMNGRGVY